MFGFSSLRKRARFVAAAVVFGGATFLVAATPYGPPICETAAEWVAQNRGTLPTNLAELDQYHPALRRAIYNELTPSQRESLWRAHFTRLIEDHGRLSEIQRAFVQDVLDRLPFYLEPATGTARMDQDRLDERIKRTFDIDLGREVFATLGASTYAAQQPIAVNRTNLFGFTPVDFPRLTGPSATSSADCSCSHGSDWCSAGMRCDASPCTPTQQGCGTLWAYPCTGDCKLDM